MKSKKCYLLLNSKNRYTYGAFPRTPEGKDMDLKYKEALMKEEVNKNIKFVIK